MSTPACLDCKHEHFRGEACQFVLERAHTVENAKRCLCNNSTVDRLITPEGDVITDFDRVGEFHKKFDLTVSDNRARIMPLDIQLFRLRFLHEELGELIKAIHEHDIVEITDALVDLVYVALGTAHHYNIPWEEAFAEVHRSNMQKERALKKEDSKRGSTWDVVKPVFWQKPDIAGVLARYDSEDQK